MPRNQAPGHGTSRTFRSPTCPAKLKLPRSPVRSCAQIAATTLCRQNVIVTSVTRRIRDTPGFIDTRAVSADQRRDAIG
jgi:hypothetical protein